MFVVVLMARASKRFVRLDLVRHSGSVGHLNDDVGGKGASNGMVDDK